MKWYEEVRRQQQKEYMDKHAAFYADPWTAAIEPFRMADGLYYVGDRKVCVHLLETAEGLILLDSGFFHSPPLLLESIRKLGFDPADVRWILHTHEHFDHFGAAELFRKQYGTKLAISAAGAASLRENPGRALMAWEGMSDSDIPVFDYELQDGEIFRFGGREIRCQLTPGHALGVMSFFFDVTDGGKTYLAGLFGGAGHGALALEYTESLGLPRDMPQRMLASLEKLMDEPVTLHLGNHPANNRTLQKRERQLAEGGNPFAEEDTWQTFLQDLRNKTLKIIADNEEKLRIHGE